MPPSTASPTWRLLELLPPAARPCPACGEVHRYLMRMTSIGDCMPVLFPPGVPVPPNVGVEVELHLAGPAEHPAVAPERSRYHKVAERVRHTSIRCEGCGARFEDLEAYRLHPCVVHYR